MFKKKTITSGTNLTRDELKLILGGESDPGGGDADCCGNSNDCPYLHPNCSKSLACASDSTKAGRCTA